MALLSAIFGICTALVWVITGAGAWDNYYIALGMVINTANYCIYKKYNDSANRKMVYYCSSTTTILIAFKLLADIKTPGNSYLLIGLVIVIIACVVYLILAPLLVYGLISANRKVITKEAKGGIAYVLAFFYLAISLLFYEVFRFKE